MSEKGFTRRTALKGIAAVGATLLMSPLSGCLSGGSREQDFLPGEIIDPAADVGSISMVIDKSGKFSVFYEASDALKFATDNTKSGSWEFGLSSPGMHSPSMALDLEDVLHLAYVKNGILYSKNNVRGWDSSVVDKSGRVGKNISLAVGPDNSIHIAYNDHRGLVHKIVGSRNEAELVDMGPVGKFPSMALDINGNPHIAHYNEKERALKYATKIDGKWFSEVVVDDNGVGEWPSLAIDGKGQVHISYTDLVNKSLKHAIVGGKVETLDSEGDTGRFSALAIGPGDTTHIVYHDPSGLNYIFSNSQGYFDLEKKELVDYSSGVRGRSALVIRPNCKYAAFRGTDGSLMISGMAEKAA